jgi:hypothetical protein
MSCTNLVSRLYSVSVTLRGRCRLQGPRSSRTHDYIFSQYGGTKVYFLNPKNYNIVACRSSTSATRATRLKSLQAQNAFVFKIYSQLSTGRGHNNRSRLAVV